MNTKLILLALALLWTVTAMATQPIAKTGPCPPGYSTYGKYCIPSKHATPAMPKAGPCPSGYYTFGTYCRRSK